MAAQGQIVGMRTNLSAAIEAWKRPGAPQVPDNIKKAADDLLKKIDVITTGSELTKRMSAWKDRAAKSASTH